jgi:hypothetical protein
MEQFVYRENLIIFKRLEQKAMSNGKMLAVEEARDTSAKETK